MNERRISRQEMLADPHLDSAQRATFSAAFARGESVWYGAEGWVIKDRQHNRRPMTKPAVVEIKKAVSERGVPKHFRPKRRRR